MWQRIAQRKNELEELENHVANFYKMERVLLQDVNHRRRPTITFAVIVMISPCVGRRMDCAE